MDIKKLYDQAQELFGKRSALLSLWQEIGDNFYPERAEFTVLREVGDEFASDLMTSFPVLARRDLGNQIGAMLRQKDKEWFRITPHDPGRETNSAKRWLEHKSAVMRRAMYDPLSRFTRAMKEGDHDFAAFGQAVISVELGRNADHLLYRCWHLRDVAWLEGEDGGICAVFRRWKPTVADASRIFGTKVHRQVADAVSKQPFDQIECMHMIVEAERYDGDAKGRPFWSLHYDITHDHLMEAIPVWNRYYAVPRWQTVSGSQYAYSPATIVALPDARLIQAMTGTLLEAGEKLVNPPMVATQDAVRSDISIFAGGVTWVDQEYDERLGEALRPLTQDARGMPFTFEIQRDVRALIHSAFFLDRLNLPDRGPEMTAYEVGQRVQQYIRNALPLFEPMEDDYNGSICDITWDLLFRAGTFGPSQEMPRELSGADVMFRFESPLHDAIEMVKGQKMLEAKALLAEAVALDPTAAAMVDAKVALRDALGGIKVPAEWIRSEQQMADIERQAQAKAEAAQVLQLMSAGADIAQKAGAASKDMAAANAQTGTAGAVV